MKVQYCLNCGEAMSVLEKIATKMKQTLSDFTAEELTLFYCETPDCIRVGCLTMWANDDMEASKKKREKYKTL